MTDGRLKGVRFAVRFHMHPDVDARLDMGGTAVSLALRSGEIWVFRHDGAEQWRWSRRSIWKRRG